MREKQAREEWNMAVIEKVYQRLSEDKGVQGRIRQIQAHPWVRVVEGDKKAPFGCKLIVAMAKNGMFSIR